MRIFNCIQATAPEVLGNYYAKYNLSGKCKWRK